MTVEREAEIIAAACKEHGLDTHIKWITKKSEAYTRAEQIATQFSGGKRQPVKNSYMYCDTMDACFFFAGGNPAFSFSGYVTQGVGDLENGRLIEAMQTAKKVLDTMRRLKNTPQEGETT